jgi:hypothetical protein
MAMTGMIALGATGAAASGSIVEKGGMAEVALLQGRGAEAVEILREALRQAWNAAPFSIVTAEFVTSKADGYGVYYVRPQAVFGANEPLVIYLEPVGFEWAERNGRYESLLTIDLELFGPDGASIVESKGFGRLEFSSRVPNTEYMTNLTLKPGGLPPARYVLEISANDEYGGAVARTRLPFEVR